MKPNFLSVHSNGSKQGFSLLELSIIITIIASVVATALSNRTSSVKSDAEQMASTRTKMEEIHQAILQFRVLNQRLPCPAASNTNLLSANDENLVLNATNVYYCPQSFGPLPTRALGLSDDYRLDAWGRRFTYVISRSLCGTGNGADTNGLVPCTVASYMDDARRGAITVDTDITGGDTTEAAYVLISYGPRGYGGTYPSGSAVPTTTGGADETANAQRTGTAPALVPDRFLARAISPTFHHIVTFKTKAQVESLARDTLAKPLTLEFCQANSEALEDVTVSLAGTMRASLISTRITPPATYVTYNYGDEAVISLLWALQETCYELYTATEMGFTKRCPGGGNATFDQATTSCICINGTWNGGSCGP